MTSNRYEELMKNTEIKNEKLYKDGKVILSVGDKLRSKVNSFREYECVSIHSWKMSMKKIKVGDFEKQELNKYQEFQVGHFLDEIEKFEKI